MITFADIKLLKETIQGFLKFMLEGIFRNCYGWLIICVKIFFNSCFPVEDSITKHLHKRIEGNHHLSNLINLTHKGNQSDN